MIELKPEEAMLINGGMQKCIPGDGQVEGSWIDRWLDAVLRSGL